MLVVRSILAGASLDGYLTAPIGPTDNRARVVDVRGAVVAGVDPALWTPDVSATLFEHESAAFSVDVAACPGDDVVLLPELRM